MSNKKHRRKNIKILNLTNSDLRKMSKEELLKVEKELDSMKKLNKAYSPELTTRLRRVITEVDGSTDQSVINGFVELVSYFLFFHLCILFHFLQFLYYVFFSFYLLNVSSYNV